MAAVIKRCVNLIPKNQLLKKLGQAKRISISYHAGRKLPYLLLIILPSNSYLCNYKK